MKIGWLVPQFPGQTHAFFWRELSALEEAGVGVTVLSTRRPDDDACPHPFASDGRSRTTYLFPPPVSTLLTLAFRPALISAAIRYAAGLDESRLKEKLKVLALAPSAAELVRLSRRTGIEHIHTHSCADAAHLVALAHDMGGPSYGLVLHGDLPVYGHDHKSKMKHASYVVAVTSRLHRQIVDRIGLPESRVPVIWMGVDTSQFTPPEKRRAADGPITLLTIARLHAAKGHAYALRAMRAAVDRGADLRYLIVGNGREKQNIVSEINRLRLDDRVELLGSVGEDRVRTLLQNADLFVLPSVGLGEAAPVSVMEAMAVGLPVICSIIGGTPDMIDDGVDGVLIEQKDEAALADAFFQLAGDQSLRDRLGAAARQRSVKQFDFRILAKRLIDQITMASGRN